MYLHQNKNKTAETQSLGTPKSSEYEKQFQNNSFNVKNQNEKVIQNRIQFEEKCQLKTPKGYYQNIKVSIRADDGQTWLFYKSKTNKFEIKCTQIKKISPDERKIIIYFNKKSKDNSIDQQNILEIKFSKIQHTDQCIRILQQFISKKSIRQEKKQNFKKIAKNQNLQNQSNLTFREVIGIVQKYFKSHERFQTVKRDISECFEKSQCKRARKNNKQNPNTQYNQSLAKEFTKLTDQLINQKEKNTRIQLSLLEITKKLTIIAEQNQSLTLKLQQKKQMSQNHQTLRQIKSLEISIQTKERQIDRLKTEIHSKKQQQIKLLEYQRKYKQVLQQKTRLQKQLKKQSQNLTECRNNLQKITSNSLHLQKKYQQLLKKYAEKESQLQKIENYATQYTKLQNSYILQSYLHIFEGPVLRKELQYKQFLKSQIQKFTKNKIYQTRILYVYDKKNLINFHYYIDGHPNLVVIAKTLNGIFLAGFSQSYVKAKQVANKGGLLLSLSNFKKFELIKNMRSVTYDDFFIIYGNSQIRIKSQQAKLFSNFGTANGYYASQGEPVNTFLGEGAERQANLENYEFHEIIFQY